MTSLYSSLFNWIRCVSEIVRFSSLPIQLYLVDAFPYAASTIAAALVSTPEYIITNLTLTSPLAISSLDRCLHLHSPCLDNTCTMPLE